MTPEAAQPALAEPASVRPIIEDLELELRRLNAEGLQPDAQPPGSIAAAHQSVAQARRHLEEALGRLADYTRRRRDIERSLEVLRASLEQDASTS